MDIFYEIEITNFVAKHLSLIEEERREECNQSEKFIQSSHDGVYVKHLNISSYRSCLGGFVLVEFRNAKNKVLQDHNLSHGDVVGVFEGTDMQNTQIAHGVVKFCKDGVIAISFEDINFSDDEHKTYSLVKLANDITYSRLKASLKKLSSISKQPRRVLAEILFGNGNDLEQIQLSPSILNDSGELKFVNLNLHPAQKEAVKFALTMKNLAVIHGPPGTGKTTTLVEIILQLVKLGNKILVCAPSNVAIDNLLEKLSCNRVKMVRLGHPARIMEDLSKYSLDAIVDSDDNSELVRDIRKEMNKVLKKLNLKCTKESRTELRSELKNLRKELQGRESRAIVEVLRRADIVLSTLVTASDQGPLKHVAEEHFDCVIIDECSQALEAACWIVLPRATKAILAGDHLQLPPTILSKKAELEGLGLSLMERVINKFGEKIYRILKCQFRMHSDIMNWPSNEMYNGVLEAHSSVANHLLKDIPSVKSVDETEMTLLFVDTSDSQFEEEEDSKTSYCNKGEAGIISLLVRKLVAANVPEMSIAVITPYNYQVEMIKSYLEDLKGVEIRSVDGFQGREKEAVLLSLVRSNPNRKLGFITDRRRLNVAVSRARRFLCVVSDSRTVCYDSTMKSLIDYITENGIVNMSEQYVSHIEMPKGTMHLKKCMPKQKIHSELKVSSTPEKNKKQKSSLNKSQNVKPKAEDTLNIKNNEFLKEDRWFSVLQDFLNSKKQELKFSKSISSYDRRLIHEAAEKLQINHVSLGEGNERYIVISKPSKTDIPKEKNKSRNNCASKESSLVLNNSDKEARNIVETLQNISKEAHEQNNSQHNVSKKSETIENQFVSAGNQEEQSTYKITEKKKKQEKVNKKFKKKQDSEDFECLIAEFQEMDKRCPWGNCKVLSELVGLTCVHCKQRFCLTHGFPEIHGCGEAARKLARHEFRSPRPPKIDPLKRNAASKKLEKKLQQMADDRKPQKKDI
ncbi:hypothetical protein L9F63_009042 [Diploptera punctata]|uniref:DNA-binding protein SMUBP-2 n=1 Tax=Diploptera punctata TaxID=6984 RepID=A0AAD7Z3Z5_DIPPU|nr:hypothetical protein L9F63_009042 [Diploptera punctata]